jgi:cell division inhibitor SulA/protein ImuA
MVKLDAHPLLWRGKQVAHHIHTLGSGHASLDKVLPGNGWPAGAITELINVTAGCGELSLLLPVLARLSQEGHWITMVDPPWIPCPSTLHGRGLALEKLLLIHTQSRAESLWACEQVIRGIPGGALLAWPGGLSFGELRRLQISAGSTHKTVFLFMGENSAASSSPAALRLQLSADDGDLRIKVLKCRGQRPVSDIRIRRRQLMQNHVPAPPGSSGLEKCSRLSSKKPIASIPALQTNHPSL